MPEKTAIQVMVVRGERPIKLLLEQALPESGLVAVAVETGDAALDLAARRRFDLSQLDLDLREVGRVETWRRAQTDSDAALVLLDQRQLQNTRTLELSLDDFRFLTRPLDREQLAGIVDEAARRDTDRRDTDRRDTAETGAETAPQPAQLHDPKAPYFGTSPPMRELLEKVHRVAKGSASVLLQGETGTGKTFVARELHTASPRADRPFVAINCGAFQDQLLESELFGYEKGAFTGASAAKPGLFEIAHQGTLFLDEIAETSPAMQSKLLQVLDEGEMRRVGATQTRRIDTRIVAASNKDLQQEVRAGRFREDLLFRLNVIHLRVPPLRERRGDVVTLAEIFFERFRLPDQPRKRFSPEASQLLCAYGWPGNVRELSNTIEGLVLLAPGEVIRAEDLPPALRPASRFEQSDAAAPLPLIEIERLHIARALRYTEGSKAPAARLLGIDVKTLNSKIKSYGIDV